jgi:hypothetical protein
MKYLYLSISIVLSIGAALQLAWIVWRNHERRVLLEAAKPYRCDAGNITQTELPSYWWN